MAEETASSVLKDKDGEAGEVNEGKMTEDFSKQATDLIEKLSDLQKVSLPSHFFLSFLFISFVFLWVYHRFPSLPKNPSHKPCYIYSLSSS